MNIEFLWGQNTSEFTLQPYVAEVTDWTDKPHVRYGEYDGLFMRIQADERSVLRFGQRDIYQKNKKTHYAYIRHGEMREISETLAKKLVRRKK